MRARTATVFLAVAAAGGCTSARLGGDAPDGGGTGMITPQPGAGGAGPGGRSGPTGVGGGGGLVTGTGGFGGTVTPTPGNELYRPCAEGTRAGGFTLQLDSTGTTTGETTFRGFVTDRPDDFSRQPVASEGGCTLMRSTPWMACPSCADTGICHADGTCVTLAIGRDVGTVLLEGLPAPVVLQPAQPTTSASYQTAPGQIPFPPAALGTPITLSATGGDYGPFTLQGRTIEPLRDTRTTVISNLTARIEWDPPAQPSASRMNVWLDLGAADIEIDAQPRSYITCDFPDTGSATIPISLVAAHVRDGISLMPLLMLTRETVDSVELAPGCVDFKVQSVLTRPVSFAMIDLP